MSGRTHDYLDVLIDGVRFMERKTFNKFYLRNVEQFYKQKCIVLRSRKRKYLQGKRGFEKPPFELPAFIKNTGITAIRDEQLRIYSEKTRKQKQRSVRGGARGKMAINYQVSLNSRNI